MDASDKTNERYLERALGANPGPKCKWCGWFMHYAGHADDCAIFTVNGAQLLQDIEDARIEWRKGANKQIPIKAQGVGRMPGPKKETTLKKRRSRKGKPKRHEIKWCDVCKENRLKEKRGKWWCMTCNHYQRCHPRVVACLTCNPKKKK